MIFKIKTEFSGTINNVEFDNERICYTISAIIEEFEDKVSLIVDGGNLDGLSSTIVSLIDKEPCIIRQGSLVLSF